MLPIAMASSFAFMLPIATPTNILTYSYGRIRKRDMVIQFQHFYCFDKDIIVSSKIHELTVFATNILNRLCFEFEIIIIWKRCDLLNVAYSRTFCAIIRMYLLSEQQNDVIDLCSTSRLKPWAICLLRYGLFEQLFSKAMRHF